MGLLAALVSGGPDSDVDAMTAFAKAAVAGGLLRPLLQLARCAQDSSAEAVCRSNTCFCIAYSSFPGSGTSVQVICVVKLRACCPYMPCLRMNLPAMRRICIRAV